MAKGQSLQDPFLNALRRERVYHSGGVSAPAAQQESDGTE